MIFGFYNDTIVNFAPMNRPVLGVLVTVAILGVGFAAEQTSKIRSTKSAAFMAEKTGPMRRPRGLAVAFYDAERLQNSLGQATLGDFQFFLPPIQQIVKRDFPDVELKILRRGQFLNLPDGTGLNVETIRPELGYVLSAPGKKRRMLTGVQTEVDFACAATDFFGRSSSDCPK